MKARTIVTLFTAFLFSVPVAAADPGGGADYQPITTTTLSANHVVDGSYRDSATILPGTYVVDASYRDSATTLPPNYVVDASYRDTAPSPNWLEGAIAHGSLGSAITAVSTTLPPTYSVDASYRETMPADQRSLVDMPAATDGLVSTSDVGPSPVAVRSDSSFQWTDAALGAGGTLGLLLLAGVIGLTIRHHSRPMLP